ncbi:hypothetical protein PA598K_00077 [Paenibacillus sp. 598K]|uniref:S-layer homology domain-containing protein n=1 Tax=Paenibacillus sp. 598K TaxID=1117987 RepID=UPI000FF9C0B3|nr:S-layer homology domain-containing protein [Paenibacillus sp. 598K]GBF71864.1 hypothetical protein PA598K_00077 [Paenibacillus sp. 598K]
MNSRITNRAWCLALVGLLLCSVWPQALFAAPEAPEFYMSVSKAEVKVGETIVVEIGLRNARELVAYELNLMFDPALWTAGSSVFTSKLSGFSGLANAELLAAGQVRGVYSKLGDAPGESGNLVLGTVKLTAKAVGAAEFTLGAIKLGDTGEQWMSHAPGIKTSVNIVSGGSSGGDSGSGSGPGGGDSGSGTGPGGGDGDGGSGGNTGESGTSGGSGPNLGKEPIITATSVLVEAPEVVDGTAQVKLSDDHMKRAIELLSGSTLRIVVKPDASTGKVAVSFPLAQMRAESGRKVQQIVIDSGLARVTLERRLIEEAESVLQFSATRLDASAIPAGLGEQVAPGAAGYHLELLLDGRSIAAFGAGDVMIELPYTLRPGETADNVVVYYIAANGKPELVKNARYNPETQTVKFNPKRFGLYFPAYVHKTFADLGKAEWARVYIEALAARDAVNGVGNGAFDPNGQLTRAQFITMLVQLFELEETSAAATFTDAKRETWYYPAVSSAQRLGIVQGKPDGSFGINDPISRQDMAVMLHRASTALGLTWSRTAAAPTFTDAASIAPYAVEAIALMQEQGIMDGMGDGSFAPQGLSTRAQAAAVLYRLFGL